MQVKILVIGPSKKTKGGITSVIKSYYNSYLWEKWNCKWIETHIDANLLSRLLIYIKGFLKYLWCLPKYNMVHIHLSWWITAIRKLPFFIFALIFKKKTVIQIHSGSEKIINSKVNFIYQFFFSNADCTIVLAEVIKQELLQKYKFKNIHVVYNPSVNVDNNDIQKKLNILFAGSINTLKGYQDLIKAFSIISEEHPDWTLTFAGNGEIEKAKKLCENLGIEQKVRFTGWISGDYKDTIFHESSIFCLPSYTEGFPMAILDAWAYRLPVICTKIGGLKDILVHEKNALIFEPGNITMLVEEINKLIYDQFLQSKLINESQILINTKFNINAIANNIDLIYKELLK